VSQNTKILQKMQSCGGCEMWDDVCSFVHEGYLTRAPIHKELCNHTPNEVSPPQPLSLPHPLTAKQMSEKTTLHKTHH